MLPGIWMRRRLAAACFSALIATGVGAQERSSAADALARAERIIDRDLTTNVELSASFLAFRELYPVEYRRMVAKLAEGGIDGAITQEDMVAALAELHALSGKYASSLIKAPNAELVAFMEKRRDALRLARTDDPAFCDALANDLLNVEVEAKSRRTRQALADVEVARMRAAKAGFDRPADRAPPTEQEWAALDQALLRSGADQRVIDQLLGDREGRNARERCNAAVVFYDALYSLPARSSAAIFGSMIRSVALEHAETAVRPSGLTVKEETFEALLAKEEYAPLFDVLEAEFPEPYAEIRKEAIASLEGEGTLEEVIEDLTLQITSVQLGFSDSIASAGDRELAEVLRTRGAALKLARDQSPGFCAVFAENYVYDPPEDASPELDNALVLYEAAVLKAIAAGLKRPVERQDLAEDDRQTLLARMQRTGIGEADLESFLAGALDDLPPRRRCDVAVALNDALAAMPARSSSALAGRMLVQLAARDELVAEVQAELRAALDAESGDESEVEEGPAPDVKPTKTDKEAKAAAKDASPDAELAAFFRLFATSFPDDYEAFTRILDEPVPAKGHDTRVARAASHFHRWARDNARYIERAPPSDLVAFGKAYTEFLRALQSTDAEACVIAASTAPRLDDALPERVYPAQMRAMGAYVVAAAAGRDRPVRSQAITDADKSAMLAEGQRLGINMDDLENLGAAPAAAQCRIEVLSHQAVQGLPPESAARVLREMASGLFAD